MRTQVTATDCLDRNPGNAVSNRTAGSMLASVPTQPLGGQFSQQHVEFMDAFTALVVLGGFLPIHSYVDCAFPCLVMLLRQSGKFVFKLCQPFGGYSIKLHTAWCHWPRSRR